MESQHLFSRASPTFKLWIKIWAGLVHWSLQGKKIPCSHLCHNHGLNWVINWPVLCSNQTLNLCHVESPFFPWLNRASAWPFSVEEGSLPISYLPCISPPLPTDYAGDPVAGMTGNLAGSYLTVAVISWLCRLWTLQVLLWVPQRPPSRATASSTPLKWAGSLLWSLCSLTDYSASTFFHFLVTTGRTLFRQGRAPFLMTLGQHSSVDFTHLGALTALAWVITLLYWLLVSVSLFQSHDLEEHPSGSLDAPFGASLTPTRIRGRCSSLSLPWWQEGWAVGATVGSGPQEILFSKAPL